MIPGQRPFKFRQVRHPPLNAKVSQQLIYHSIKNYLIINDAV
jgi:hypothetical protein